MESADIVVIGGGVIGGAVAFYLAKQNVGRDLPIFFNDAPMRDMGS